MNFETISITKEAMWSAEHVESAAIGIAKGATSFNLQAGKGNSCTLSDLKDQLKIINSEIKELNDAVDNNNPVKIIDGCIDSSVTLAGMLQQLVSVGVNVRKAAELISENNDSKFPTDISIVKATLEQNPTYKAQYNDFSCTYVIKDGDNKVRKPVGFVDVDISDCIPNDLKQGFKG